MSVSSYSQPDVVTVEGEASLREVATKLDDENVGTVVVVEGDEPLSNSYQRFFEECEDAGTRSRLPMNGSRPAGLDSDGDNEACESL